MKTIYLISDLHLDARRRDIATAFAQWLQQLPADAHALYILGDFFDAWIGDDDPCPFRRQVAEQLRNFSRGDRKLYIMHGNRDFLLGQGFAEATGGELLADPTVVTWNHERILLTHGDTLCTDDHAYLAWRELSRQPEWQSEFLAKPIPERRHIAASLRQQSRAETRMKPEEIMDVNTAEVQRVQRHYRVQKIIHGHTHRPARHPIGAGCGERIVLGDWDRRGWMVRVRAEGIDLIDFPLT